MVRELEDPQDQALHLLFDATQVWGEDRDTTLEYAIKIIAGVADYARRQAVPVQVWGGSLSPQQDAAPSPDRSPAPTDWPRLLHGLALAAPGDGPSLARSLRQLPPGASALVVVSAGDLHGWQALRLTAPTLRRLSVVSLEGFGEAPALAVDSLQVFLAQARGQLVRCRPGNLLGALQSLEQAEGGLAPRTTAPAQPDHFAEMAA